MLIKSRGFIYEQPNYNVVKQSYELTAWTRATSEWDLECEAKGKTRKDAAGFYEMKFGNNHKMAAASLFSVLMVTILVFCCLFSTCCGWTNAFQCIGFSCSRLTFWLFGILIVLNLAKTESVLDDDMILLKQYKAFG